MQPRFATLIILTAVPLMTLNIFLPSLVEMALELNVDYRTISLAISGYMVSTAALQILAGPLSDRFGRRPVLLVGFLLFIFASMGCALSTGFTSFLVFRILQGAVICGVVLSRAIVSDIATPRQAASLLGYIGMAMSLSPIISPFVGGLVGNALGWRASFWLLTGIGLGVWLLVWWDLRETASKRMQGNAALFRSYLALLTNSSFWNYTIIISLSVGGFYIFITGVPLIGSHGLGMNQTQVGVAIGTISIGFFLGNFLSGRFSGSVSLDKMILFGRLVSSTGLMFGLLLLIAGWVSPYTVFGSTLFVGLGNGLTLPSANAAAMAIRQDIAGGASGLSGAVFTTVGALLSLLTGTLLMYFPQASILVGLMLGVTLISLMLSFRAVIHGSQTSNCF